MRWSTTQRRRREQAGRSLLDPRWLRAAEHDHAQAPVGRDVMSANFVWLLVEHEGAVLLALRRDDGGAFAGRWTLPGGEAGPPGPAGAPAPRLASKQLATEVMGLAPFSTLSVDDAGVARTVDVLRIGYEGRPRYRPSGPFAEVGWADPAEPDALGIQLPPGLGSGPVRGGGRGPPRRTGRSRHRAAAGAALAPRTAGEVTKTMLLLIDNYDSFTYNLYQYLFELGETGGGFRNH